MQLIRKLNLRDDRGMSTVEYIILMAVIVVGAITVWHNLGGNIGVLLDKADRDVQFLHDETE